jgi:TolB-like protein/Tfp pilus assembly protein PilF
LDSFITQLKRRQVFKVATIYAVSAWPLIQLADLSVPALGLPDSVMTLLLKIFIAGFPVCLVFAWLFNFTDKGIVRASANTDELNQPQANVRTTIAVAGTLSLILMITLGSQLMLDEHQVTNTTLIASNQSEIQPAVLPLINDAGKESIAILPFVPFSNDPEDEFFADGMVEELLNLLAKLPNLQVAARTSSFAYKGITNKTIPQIGRELGVDTILEGSIRKNDTTNKIRVTAQLIKVSTGEHLWSETYDREYRDIFQIQDDIAHAVVKKMKITLLGAPSEEHEFHAPTTSVDAMVAYGKGQKELSHRTTMSINTAMDNFQQAITFDPNYARAYVGIADANNLLALYGNISHKEARANAQQAIDKALALDDKLAEAYAAKGLMLRSVDGEKSEIAFKKAIALNGNYAMTYMWYGTLLQSRGDVDTAHKLLEKAFELDPKSPVAAYLLAWSHYAAGAEGKAMELFSHIIANDPYYPEAYNLVGQILLKRGRLDESIPMFKRSLDVDALNKSAVRGLLSATMDMGSFDLALQWFDYARKHDELFSSSDINGMMARYHFTQGEREKAFEYMDRISLEDDHEGQKADAIEAQKAYFQENYNAAVIAYERIRHKEQNSEDAFYRRNGGRSAAHLAHAYAQLEMTDKLNELLAGLERYLDKNKQKQVNNSSYYYTMALIKTIQHKQNEAFYYLQGAIDVGWVRAWEAEAEPILKPVNKDIQFTLMMGGVKARLATMRTRMADEEAFMMEGTEEI